jgi:hypothetical protein
MDLDAQPEDLTLSGAEFSDVQAHSNGKVEWSPDGEMLAVLIDRRLVIRDGDSLDIISMHR